MYLIFDTETTGLPRDFNAPLSNSDNWPRIVQIAWQLHDANGRLLESDSLIVKPEGFTIPYGAVQVHHITTEKAIEKGLALAEVLQKFRNAMDRATYLVGHNIQFDQNIVGAEFLRLGWEETISNRKVIDTSHESTEYCQLPGGKGGKFKFPRLGELHQILFEADFSEAHNAGFDVEATTRCFFELAKRNVISREDLRIPDDITDYLKSIANEVTAKLEVFQLEKISSKPVVTKEVQVTLTNDLRFSHLHNHSQYSVLQSTTDVDELVKMAASYNMPGLALTDNGNLYAAFAFWQSVYKHNKGIDTHNKAIDAGEKEGEKKQRIKCIIGTEININKDHKNRQNQDNGYAQVLYAKNRTGYNNLLKLSSISWVDGFYYVPRIDKNVLSTYKEGLIVTTGWLNSEIPSLILNVGETQAEEAFQWWLSEFGDDFYIELNRHNIPEENVVNEVLLRWAKKYNVKYIATNNNYYLRKQQARAHDVLLCIKEGEKVSTPIGRGRG
ncbi:MAG: PHP domain-containing protein, partial [Flavobacteriales bacterium]